MHSSRRRRTLIGVFAALVAIVAAAAPVGAATPQDVTIVSHVTFDPDGNYGDFIASGPAVTSGLICGSGTFIDTRLQFAGFQGRHGIVQLLVVKEFTCDDGTGTFEVKLQIRANFDTGIETFTWTVLGGTDQYESLHGGGHGSTVGNPPTGNINTYVGKLLG